MRRLVRSPSIASFVALALVAIAGSTAAHEGPPAGAGPGLLFSTLPCAETALGREWDDATFRPHVSLATARHRPPTAADRRALGAFRRWLEKRIAADPARFTVAVGPESPVLLWVAGTPRPPDAPAYVPVEALCETPTGSR